MLSREQVKTMLVLRQREGNLFTKLPTELIREIIGWRNGDIAQALQYAAYAR
ncbi:hypothetical protein [Legionella rowbothamii]|uniref:hypothetical protein n=1 Tax=Legionella rowbothamii TaxID=96229 RepID=UPI0013EF97A6|nr:hypothetical protein [Legionella rowbothamii]